MKHFYSIKKLLLTTIVLILLGVTNANAALDATTLTTNINNLILQGDDLLVIVKSTTLTTISMDSQIESIKADVSNYQTQIISTYDTVLAETGTTFSLSDDLLVAFQSLITVNSSIAKAVQELGLQITDIAASTSLSTLDSSLTTMLRLSDDIGLMADRILEMANKILVMANNIGLMADRIIATQIIQSDNLNLIVNATLQTQINTIELIKLFL